MVFTGADDRSGELLSLCYRQQWEKARALLVHAALTVSCVNLPCLCSGWAALEWGESKGTHCEASTRSLLHHLHYHGLMRRACTVS